MDCPLCRGAGADADLLRTQVWEDGLWRLTASLVSEVPGFCYLEPKRHVQWITELDGPEAASFGPTLARVSRALKEATGAELIYMYVFGGSIPHLHVHLAPHREGDGLSDQMIKGNLVEQKLPSGLTLITSDQYPPLPESELRAVALRIASRLSD